MQPRLTSMSCFVHLWWLQMTNEPLKLKSGVKQSVSGIRCVFQKRLLMAELPLGLKAKIWDSWMMFNWSFQNTQELTPINPPTHSDIHTHAEETCMLKCTQTRHQPVLLFFFLFVQSSHDSMGGKRHLGAARRHGHGNAVLDFLPSQWKTWNKSI